MKYERVKVEKRLRLVEGNTTVSGIFNFPVTVAVGLGVFANCSPSPESLSPLFANPFVSNGLLAFGVSLVTFFGYRIIKLSAENNQLRQELEQ